MSDRPTVAEVMFSGAWNVQGDPARSDFIDEVLRIFAIALPVSPNSTSRSDQLLAFWLGPRSWLLVAERTDSPQVDFTAARDALNAFGGALFDVSASRVAFRISGPSAAAILAAGCPLDFHAGVFRAGACAQSVFGRVNALVYKEDAAPTFTVLVARSFARDVSRALHGLAVRYDRSPV